MIRRGSRFFDGYEVEYTEQGRRLRYTAEWYGFIKEGTQKRLKKTVSGLILGMLLFYILAQFFPSSGGMARYIAIPTLLSLVPMIFLLMGWVNFLMAKERWELRVYYAGYRRLYRSCLCLLPLLVLWWLFECFYMGTHLAEISGELRYFGCLTACGSVSAVLLALLRRNPAQVVGGPEIK